MDADAELEESVGSNSTILSEIKENDDFSSCESTMREEAWSTMADSLKKLRMVGTADHRGSARLATRKGKGLPLKMNHQNSGETTADVGHDGRWRYANAKANMLRGGAVRDGEINPLKTLNGRELIRSRDNHYIEKKFVRRHEPYTWSKVRSESQPNQQKNFMGVTKRDPTDGGAPILSSPNPTLGSFSKREKTLSIRTRKNATRYLLRRRSDMLKP
ncbi:hypothetical protein AXG93_1129s1040 [Marchantia polymorpha subsp. ruderalis]|uniref:Uncharacterized protein n=1 Tax=Marchantia polymorpha subsp. ruderalis TaxID=1480154 RepID=A0A176W3I7_MARPO|nr:hypothetical protein AXG93_1129s1040 [Marchantia polymorpha subsp. ruderalis]